jgi:Na+-driven multidrug efflux pump
MTRKKRGKMKKMENENASAAENPLGSVPVNSLLVKFAVPSIIAMLVGALYNIVDQIFIGNYVGELGNAATNIAFPLYFTLLSQVAVLA